VERSSEPVPFANRHHLAFVLRNNLNLRPQLRHDWGADEHRQARLIQSTDRYFILKAVHLRPESVPADGDVEKAQRKLFRSAFHLTGHQDHSHAGPPNRHSSLDPSRKGAGQPEAPHQHADRGAFAARNDDPIDAVEVLCGSDLPRFGAALTNGDDVFVVVALNRDDTNQVLNHFRLLAVDAALNDAESKSVLPAQ